MFGLWQQNFARICATRSIGYFLIKVGFTECTCSHKDFKQHCTLTMLELCLYKSFHLCVKLKFTGLDR